MALERFYDLWDMLLRFSNSAWTFLTTDVGTFVWNFIRDSFPETIEDLVRIKAWTDGYPVPEMMFRDLFGNMTMLELILGGGITFFLGYKFVTWILDVFF